MRQVQMRGDAPNASLLLVARRNPDAEAIAGIVRYCGIALQSRDSALVSFTDDAEVERVRVNFLKKKLALTIPTRTSTGRSRKSARRFE